MLFAALAATLGFWCLAALVGGLALHWPTLVLGVLAAAVVAGVTTAAVLFRVIGRQHRA